MVKLPKNLINYKKENFIINQKSYYKNMSVWVQMG